MEDELPADSSDASLEALCTETARFERRRWAGVVLMYSPLFFILSFLALAVPSFTPLMFGTRGPPQISAVQTVVMLPAALGMLASPLLFVIGIFVRASGATSLARAGSAGGLEHLPGAPPIRSAERLGAWIVAVAGPDRVVLLHRLCPPALFGIMRWGATSFVLFLAVVGVALAVTGQPAALVGGLGTAAMCLFFLRPFLLDRRIEVVSSGLVSVFERVHPIFPARVTTFALTSVHRFPHAVRLEGPDGLAVTVEELASYPPLGAWQARRLAMMLEQVGAS